MSNKIIKVKYFIWMIFIIILLSFSVADSSAKINNKNDTQRIKFIHYKDLPTNVANKASNSACSKLIGGKWKNLPVNYIIDTANTDGLSPDFVKQSLFNSAERIDAVTSSELFLNAFSTGTNLRYGINDNNNVITFALLSDNNAIAITYIWYSRSSKQIYDADIVFNSYYNWGDATQNPSLMDLENIATHELGHVVGLGDVYSLKCTEVTMYGYSGYGETKKRTLETADINALKSLYG